MFKKLCIILFCSILIGCQEGSDVYSKTVEGVVVSVEQKRSYDEDNNDFIVKMASGEMFVTRLSGHSLYVGKKQRISCNWFAGQYVAKVELLED